MTTYYADFDLGTGDNDGGGDGANRDDPTQSANWTNAWKTMADAIAGTGSSAPAAGDTVYCRGTDTVTSAITNALAGDVTSGFIRWIGVNASGNNDGTRTVLSASGLASNIDLISVTGAYNLYENFAFTGAVGANGDGFAAPGDQLVLINCSSYSNGGAGFNISGSSEHVCIRCTTYSNSGSGFVISGYSKNFFCSAYDNEGSGFYAEAGYSTCIGCLSWDNTDDGFSMVSNSQTFFNCVADGNEDDGISQKASVGRVTCYIGNRITNQSGSGDIGLFLTYPAVYGWNFFDNNTDHLSGETISYAVTNNGAATNVQVGAGGGDTLQGYTDDDPKDYNLASDATLRRTAITIPTS